jgi:GrpB-like predicted nucleotidyltransferase (UPF0157 family)
MILGLKRGAVRLVPHQKGWAKAFADERRRLAALLNEPGVLIEHVGSTAVSGLVAKPVIDIAIGVDAIDRARWWPQLLAPEGYTYFGDREGRGEHFFAKGPERRRTFYLHVMELRSERWRNYLIFRDRLRRSPLLKAEYEALKIGAVRKTSNRDAYAELKDEFVERLVARPGTRSKPR